MGNIHKRYIKTASVIQHGGFVWCQIALQIRCYFHLPLANNMCALIMIFLIGTSIAIAQNTISETVRIHIYSTEPHKLVGLSRLKQAAVFDVQIIDLSVISETQAVFNTYISDDMKKLSVAEIKASVERLPRDRLQQLADAQLALFNLQTRYDITLDDLPIVIFASGQSAHIYKGNDVYAGFLLWQQSR